MKHILFSVLALSILTACTTTENRLKQRANELCAYIPDHELLEKSRNYLTDDFYAVLDTMFYHLPEHEAMDHEWLYYFVTGNGGTVADYTVLSVKQIDKNHAVATILVQQLWPEGLEGDIEDEPEKHRLYMDRVHGQWLMSDFDEHKADCIRYIANNRKEQALRDAISEYLIRNIAPFYLQGELCIPTLMMVAEEDSCVWGDFWIWWYQLNSDTLKTVSGGNHAGKMTIAMQEGKPMVTTFEQTVDGAGNATGAKRIFGSHYDIYLNMHSNADVREAVRKEQLGEYIRHHNISARYYQDYGWPAVEL